MVTILLVLVYMASFSLGLPDALLGAAWPVMSVQLHANLSWAGILSAIISSGTILSSFFSYRITKKWGTGLVAAISIGMTAVALAGIAFAGNFWIICLFAIPYGLGAGAVDAALNNYLATHYSSKYMNWLHCFWGIGATVGPYIMSWAIGTQKGWRLGYGTTAWIQFAFTAILFATLFLWRNKESAPIEDISPKKAKPFKIPGVKKSLIAMFAYNALEATAGLWASSYFVHFRGVDPVTAAQFAALYYLSITVGRLFCGFVADYLGDSSMIRGGTAVLAAGILLILQPLPVPFFALGGLVILGLGASPIYPAIVHATPSRFGKENGHAIVGMQVAFGYIGSTTMPPLFGFLGQHISLGLFPWLLGIFLIITILATKETPSEDDNDE